MIFLGFLFIAFQTDEGDQEEVVFADNAFPPTVSDVKYHKKAWYENDCLRCHETGVGDATVVKHADMPDILLTAKCRTCHVVIPGKKAITPAKTDEVYEDYAFPPMIPASDSHQGAWYKDNCLLCHEDGGVRDAPVVLHKSKDLPKILLKAKCRTCHVQVRSFFVPDR